MFQFPAYQAHEAVTGFDFAQYSFESLIFFKLFAFLIFFFGWKIMVPALIGN